MRAYFVIILLLVSVAVGTILHATKLNRPDELTSFTKGISPLRSYIKDGVGFKGEPAKGELLSWARFSLAPVYISDSPADTTLIIQYRHSSDTSLAGYIAGRQIIYQHNDGIYTYLIVAN